MGIDLLSAGLGFGSSLLDAIGGSNANRANQAAIEASNRQRTADREALLNAFTGSGPGGSVTRRDGGFDVSSPGFEELAAGDPGRAATLNAATSNQALQPQSRQFYEAGVRSDQANRQANIDFGLQNIEKTGRRAGGGIENTGMREATLDAMNRFARDNTSNTFAETENAFNQGNQGRNAVLSQLIANMMPKVNPPGTPGTAAGSALAQMPQAQFAPDLGGAVFPAAASNALQQLYATNERDNLIRQLGNAGAFGSGGGGNSGIRIV